MYLLKTKSILTSLLICAFLYSSAQQKNLKVMESFEEAIPAGLKATGDISLDTKRMKYGDTSLKWQWKGNDQIIFDTPIGYQKQHFVTSLENLGDGHGGSKENPVLAPPRGFFVYVYNEKASEQRIRFQFGRGDIVDCEFDFNLNFKGWRTCAVGYDRGDMRGTPREDMDRLTINAPATGSGTFFFDMMGLSVTTNPRTVNANPQLPEIDKHPRLISQYPHMLYEWSKYRPQFNLEPLTAATLSDFRKIEQNLVDICFPPYEKSQYADDKFEGIKKKFDQFEITREGENIYGRPLVYNKILGDYFSELKVSKDKKYAGVMRWRQELGETIDGIAKLYTYTESADIKTQLETMFIDLFDYSIDQGFDYGEGLGWIHHYSYIIREHGPAFYLMRDVLKKHNKLEKAIEVCKWFYGFNQVYNEEYVYDCKDRKAGNADEIQGLLMPKLMCALMMDDSPEKARDIKHFSSYYSKVFTAYANALDECYKPDGTFFHHAGHAFGYGGRAVFGGVATGYLLSGTQYAATHESYKRMKKVVTNLTACLFTQDLMAPKAFASIRFSNYALPEQFYIIPAVLACSATPFDNEMGALYTYLISKYSGKPHHGHTFWKNKVDAEMKSLVKYDFNAVTQLPYSCVTLKRNADHWMIALRSHSKYVYPFESWGPSYFAFPLFIGNGYLDVSYPNDLDSQTPKKGTWHKGYNWHRWPGTTSVNLPYNKMLTNPGQVRDEGGEYLFSDQAFAGGVETSYGMGISVFQFKGHDKFGIQGFSGKKSYFFFDDKVLCLGTNITSNLADYNVETTLFQTALNHETDAILCSSNESISAFPFQDKLKQNSWIIDNRGTGYFIIDGTDINLTKSIQTNAQYQNKGEVSGNIASAWINHGKAPKDASYQYILLANASEEKMDAIKKNSPVKVLQKDEVAHVVEIISEKATAYAVYKKDGTSFKKGNVKAVNKQATFMVKDYDGKLVVSVADPDLNIYDGQDDLLPDGSRCELSVYEREWFYWPSRPSKVQITINGQWQIEKQLKEMETAEVKNARILSSSKGQTVIEFECKDGLSAEVLLSK